MKKRDSNQQPLKEVLENWLDNHPNSKKASETRIEHLWGDLLGPSVKKRTERVRFNNGKLFVKLNSSVLKNELSFAKSQIILNLNKELGQELVQELIFN